MMNETCIKIEANKQAFAFTRLSHTIATLLILGGFCAGTPSWSQAIYGSPANHSESKERPQVDSQMPTRRPIPEPLSLRQKIAQHQLAGRKSVPSDQSTQYSYISINIANTAYVQPYAINNAGVVVGNYADTSFVSHGFIWQHGTLQLLDYPGAAQTAFTGVNDSGVAVGTYLDANNYTYAFTYSLSSATWTDLPALPDTWQPFFGVGGINDKGEIVGFADGFDGYLSWEWHPDSQSYSYFTSPAASEASTIAQGINNRGSKLGIMSLVNSNSPFLFLLQDRDRETIISLPPDLLAAQFFGPFGINDHDTIVGTFSTANFGSVSGFMRDRNGAFVVVNEPGADQTYLTGINDFGVLVGDAYYSTTGANPGFVAYPLQ